MDELVMLQDDAMQSLAARGQPAGLVGPQHPPHPAGGPHHCRPGGRHHTGADHVAEAVQLRRGCTTRSIEAELLSNQ